MVVCHRHVTTTTLPTASDLTPAGLATSAVLLLEVTRSWSARHPDAQRLTAVRIDTICVPLEARLRGQLERAGHLEPAATAARSMRLVRSLADRAGPASPGDIESLEAALIRLWGRSAAVAPKVGVRRPLHALPRPA